MSFFEFPGTRTYNSDLGWLIKCMDKLLDDYDGLLADYEAIKKALENINKTINDSIDAKMADVWAQIDTYTALFNSFSTRVNNLEAGIFELKDYMKEYTDSQVSATQLEIYNFIAKELGEFEAKLKDLERAVAEFPDSLNYMDPTTGEVNKLQFILNHLYDSSRMIHGITVAEYGAMGISVNEYAGFNMSVKEYAMKAKAILNRFWKWHTNCITGLKNTVDNLFSWSITTILNTPTVNEYASRDLTVEEYSALDYTVYEYLTSNPGANQVLALGGSGLTVNEYNTITTTTI